MFRMGTFIFPVMKYGAFDNLSLSSARLRKHIFIASDRRKEEEARGKKEEGRRDFYILSCEGTQ